MNELRDRLITECGREEQNCLYTSTKFYIWLRFLKFFRAILWAAGIVCGAFAASSALKDDPANKVLVAFAAIGAVGFPAVVRGLKLDSTISEYVASAASFKNLEHELHRAATVWSVKPIEDYEAHSKSLFIELNEARSASLTPPDICYWLAKFKIEVLGHYNNS